MSMLGPFTKLLPIGFLFFATFSSSPNFGLNSYSVGPGASNSSSSTTYKAQVNVGEQSNQSTSSATYISNSGAVKTEQLNLPQAPTLSNGSGTYYDKLQVTITPGILPSDTTFAVAVSTNSFVTTNYLQSDGTLNSTPVYQTYLAWGSSSGTTMVGLTPSTTYEAKVAAKQGLFTNTEYGPYASAATVSPSITFSLSPSSESLGNLNSGTVITSASPVIFNLATNANSGGSVFVAGQNHGLKSTHTGYTIAALSANLSTQSEGFGLQGTSVSQTSGGPLVIQTPYNGSANNVGTESTTYVPIFTSATPIVGGIANMNILAKSATTDPAGQDYQEILTFVASASF